MTSFPVLSKRDKPYYPKDRRCPVCGGSFEKGIVYVSGGALLLSADGRDSIDTDRLQGFLNVGIHGRDPEMRDSSDITVVQELCGGQFDLTWCSVACLRKWLSDLLKQVESLLGGGPPTGMKRAASSRLDQPILPAPSPSGLPRRDDDYAARSASPTLPVSVGLAPAGRRLRS